MKKRIILYILTVIGLSSVWGKGYTLYILHTNNTNGALENCYCPDHPLGSLEKRAVFISGFLEKHPNSIVVDAGDFFSVTHRPVKDSLVAEAYGMIPYDAILPGDQELTRDEDFLRSILPIANAHFVTTNLQYPQIPNSVPYLILERGGLNIAVLGILGGQAFKYYSPDVRESLALMAPVAAIRETLSHIRDQVDIVVVLSHQGHERDQKLAEQLDGIEVLIGAHSQTVVTDSVIVNDILVAQAGKEGYYVGVIRLDLNEEKRIVSRATNLEAMTLEMPDDPRIMELIHRYEEMTGMVNLNKLKQLEGP